MGRVKLKIRDCGTATLSGFNYRHLREILVYADIYAMEELGKIRHKKRKSADDKEMEQYRIEMKKRINYFYQAVDQGIKDTFPKKPEMLLTKKQRWAIVKENQLLDSILVDWQNSNKDNQ
jgi:hypothetical protein